MCRVMARPECAEDSRFSDLAARKANEDELDQLVSEWTRRNSPYTVMHLLQAVGVAAAPVMSVFDLVANRHLKERGYFVDIDHPEVGPRSTPGLPVKLSAIPKFNYFPAPQLGQHNERVFKDILGMDDATYDQLVREQVIF
jgi:crotonobetainyl-CoA:carnitine CoA-transferase CaiB-like acyl-CoA transferase